MNQSSSMKYVPRGARELKPLKAISDTYPATVLTTDKIGPGNDNGIKISNIIDWLLE